MDAANGPGQLRLRGGGFGWRLFEVPPNAAWEQALARPRAWLQAPAQHLKKPLPGSPSEVVRVELPGVFPEPVVVKHYWASRWLERLKDCWRGPRAVRAARWALALRKLEVATICPIAAGTRWWMPWDSYLVSRLVAPTCTFHEFAATHRSSLQRRPVIYGLAELLARLHQAGVSHQDAHLGNFILHLRPAPAVFMVDLDGLRRFRTLSWGRAAKDLQRLLYYTPASRSEQLRFIVKYCRRRGRPGAPRELLALIRSRYDGPGARHP